MHKGEEGRTVSILSYKVNTIIIALQLLRGRGREEGRVYKEREEGGVRREKGRVKREEGKLRRERERERKAN